MDKELTFDDIFKYKSVSFKIAGVEYDIMKKEDVEKIPCLSATANIFGRDYGVDYILRKNAEYIYENNGNFDLANACIHKSNELTQAGYRTSEKSVGNKTGIITICFENGVLQEIFPSNKYNQYTARFLISDGLKFDLEKAADIKNIPIPKYENLHGFPNISHSIDYVLKRKASDLSKKGFFDLSIICLQKANQLMSESPIHWKKKDYMDIVLELARVGRYDEAKQEKAFIEDNYFIDNDFSSMHETVLQKTLSSSHQLATDLLESADAPNCNELCAKYRKRIYSVSGKDKRFPALTNEIYNSGLIFFPFIEGISRPKYCSLDNIIEYSNRPFVDDRTDEEKGNYKRFSKQRILEERYATDFLEYCQICDFISPLRPKSFKLYQEMKYDNTENFQELMQVAEESGIDIEL